MSLNQIRAKYPPIMGLRRYPCRLCGNKTTEVEIKYKEGTVLPVVGEILTYGTQTGVVSTIETMSGSWGWTIPTGSELITDGGFYVMPTVAWSMDADWTIVATVPLGIHAHKNPSGGGGSIYQDINVTAGRGYQVSYDVKEILNPGSMCVYIGTVAGTDFGSVLGIFTETIIPAESGAVEFEIWGNGDWHGSIDNVSVYELMGTAAGYITMTSPSGIDVDGHWGVDGGLVTGSIGTRLTLDGEGTKKVQGISYPESDMVNVGGQWICRWHYNWRYDKRRKDEAKFDIQEGDI